MRALSLALHLSLAGIAGSSLFSIDAAWAQSGPVFEAGALIELVPPTGVIGDGASPADVYLLALNADGSPITGVKWKVGASNGTVGEFVEVGGGLYRMTYTGGKVDQVSQVSLNIKGKVGKDNVARSFTINVSPTRAHSLAIASNPPALTLGQDKTATLSINLSGGDRASLNAADLKILASTGTVTNVTNLGGGQFSALYTVPTVPYPHVAILSVVDRADPTHSYGTLAIPLSGKVDYPVTVAPNARVMMKIAGQQFGPVQADAQGRARVPVVVPPGVSAGEIVQIDASNQSVTQPIDLKVPESRRVALMPTASAFPSDARVGVPLRAVVTTADGKPDGNAQVVFTTSAGTITAATHEGNGVYVATWNPPNGNAAGQATVNVALADKPTTQADSLALSLVPARPAKLVLSSEPTALPPGADGLKVFAKVSGPDGAGLGGRALSFSANGAKLKDAVKDLRNGDYQALFSTTGSGAVEVMATVASSVTGNPLARVVAIPVRSRLPADGLSNTALFVATLDEFGYPVPNVPLTLKLSSGDGALPQQGSTNAEGTALIYYTAGRKNQLVNMEVNANGKVATASVLQVPDALSVAALPPSGSKAERDLLVEWSTALGSLRVEREGQTGMMVPAMTAPTAIGRASRAALSSEPASVAPGGTVKLRIKIMDDNGAGVGGQKLDFLTSAGTVGAVSDLGGGNYEAQLQVPANASGDLRVSVATVDGGASSFIRVPVGGAESAWATTPTVVATTPAPAATTSPFAPPAAVVEDPFATSTRTEPATTPAPTPAPSPTPVATTPTSTASVAKVKKTPAPAGDHPWMRIRLGGAVGAYEMHQLETNPSQLFDGKFSIPTTSYGAQGQVRAFIPGVPYVGLELGGAFAYWAVDAGAFCDKLGTCDGGTLDDFNRDFRVLAIGRYAFDVGANRYGVGIRAGGMWSDTPYVTVGDALAIDHETMVGGLALGAEVSAEFGEHVFVDIDLTEGFAAVSAPYDTRVGGEVGYAFTRSVFASLGLDASFRAVELEKDGEKIGEVSDSTVAGLLSIGIQI